MSILLSAYSCCPLKGSELGNGWNWAVEIAKKGEVVFCYTRSIFSREITAELSKLELSNLHFVFVDPPPLFEKYYNHNKIGLYLHYIVWQWTAYLAAKRNHLKHKYSIVHHVTFASLQLGSYMYKLNLPFIFGPVGGGQFAPEKFKSYFGKYWKIEIARRLTSWFLLSFNPGSKQSIKRSFIVLVSNSDTQVLAKRIGAKATLLYFDTGLPKSFFPMRVPISTYEITLKILWVGRLMPRKGLKLVLDSLARIKSIVDFHFTIVGDGEMGICIDRWLMELGLIERVTWLGQIPFEDVKVQYMKSDLFILTSLRDSCPAQLLEAMAYGLPVITLNLHGASLAVPSSAGIKIEPTTPDQTINDIGKAIQQFSGDRELMKQMGANAYHYALEQTWDKKVGFIYEEFYTTIRRKDPNKRPPKS